MYPEFVPIYIMLAIVILMLGAVLFFLIKLLKNGTGKGNSYGAPQQNNEAYYDQQYQQPYQVPYQSQYHQQAGNVVFCKHCAAQFDASQACCPQCGTRR